MFFGLIVIVIGLGLTFWAQVQVQGSFAKYSKVAARSGMTGAEVARHILDDNGLHDVPVEMVRGKLTDHYDPTRRAVRLSEAVYPSHSIAAVSVAAHECGHALQHKEAYGFLSFRHRLFPLLRITSGTAPFLLLIGFLLNAANLILLGIIFFATVVLFHMVTLPVEFNASSRAKQILISNGWVSQEEERGVNKVLNAAAFTYVASALVALLQLLHYILIFLGGRNNE